MLRCFIKIKLIQLFAKQARGFDDNEKVVLSGQVKATKL
jgi:hypothetical protein